MKCNRLRAVGYFFSDGILSYVKEKNSRMCVRYCVSDIRDCCFEMPY